MYEFDCVIKIGGGEFFLFAFLEFPTLSQLYRTTLRELSLKVLLFEICKYTNLTKKNDVMLARRITLCMSSGLRV